MSLGRRFSRNRPIELFCGLGFPRFIGFSMPSVVQTPRREIVEHRLTRHRCLQGDRESMRSQACLTWTMRTRLMPASRDATKTLFHPAGSAARHSSSSGAPRSLSSSSRTRTRFKFARRFRGASSREKNFKYTRVTSASTDRNRGGRSKTLAQPDQRNIVALRDSGSPPCFGNPRDVTNSA